jgi:Zn-dependent protease with chaperone function
MTTFALGAIVSLAAAGVTTVVVSLVCWAIWRTSAPLIAAGPPRTQTQVLAALRLAPIWCSVLAATLSLIAFLRLEPPDARDTLGLLLPIAAVATLGGFGRRVARAFAAWRDTERTLTRWQMEGTGFPTVAVVGIVRPQLYVSRQVVAACDRTELDAMIAHEMAHVSARDNLTRFLYLCAPFAPARIARELEEAWISAADEAADDIASTDQQSALALASALTKVARLALNGQSPTLHASAILSDGGIERRVRRLLQQPAASLPIDLRPMFALTLLFATGIGFSSPVQRALYEAAEYCVKHLV